MIKRLSLLACLLVMFASVQAQFDTSFAKQRLRICADSMMYGFKTRDWALFTRYSYPALVGSMGGSTAYAEYIGNMFSQVPDSAWKKYAAGKILQIVQSGKDLQAVIELNSIIEWRGSRVNSTSYLIGESWNGGLYWTFFDSQGDAEASKQVNANLSPELIIPKTKEIQEPVSPASKKKPNQ